MTPENVIEKCITDQNRDREGVETVGTDCGSGNRFRTGAALNKLFKHALNTAYGNPHNACAAILRLALRGIHSFG